MQKISLKSLSCGLLATFFMVSCGNIHPTSSSHVLNAGQEEAIKVYYVVYTPEEKLDYGFMDAKASHLKRQLEYTEFVNQLKIVLKGFDRKDIAFVSPNSQARKVVIAGTEAVLNRIVQAHRHHKIFKRMEIYTSEGKIDKEKHLADLGWVTFEVFFSKQPESFEKKLADLETKDLRFGFVEPYFNVEQRRYSGFTFRAKQSNKKLTRDDILKISEHVSSACKNLPLLEKISVHFPESVQAKASNVLPSHLQERKTDIFSAENALVDILVKVDDKQLETLKLEKGSMHLAEESKQNMLSRYLRRYFLSTHEAGGSAANMVRGATALGAKTVFSSVIGEDSHGQFFAKRLQDLGIETSLQKLPGKTGTAISFVTPNGERTFSTHLGVNSGISEQQTLQKEAIQNAKVFFTTGYMLSAEQPARAIKAALNFARESKTWIAIDIADPNVVKRHSKEIWEQIKAGVDILFANAEESKALVGVSGSDAAALLSELVRIAVVKDGSKGAYIGVKGEEPIFIATVPRNGVPVVDTTGAGDMFAGGFLYSLTQGHSLETSGEVASILAGDVISRMGVNLSTEAIRRVQSHLKIR